MKQPIFLLLALSIFSAALLSIPWLVPHTGAFVLVGFVPLLCADAIARQHKFKQFWLLVFLSFILWNTATTFWVCNATVGGGIFAIVANSLQMLAVWMLYRLAHKVFHGGAIPYIFLAATWIAWEKVYFNVDISWPWLVLGNAFARSTQSIQWYEYTGALGGSLWAWAVNLGIFGLIVTFSDGRWRKWTRFARICAVVALPLLIAVPLIISKSIYNRYEEKSEGSIKVLIAQPNFDPYEKFESLTQSQQTDIVIGMCREGMASDRSLADGPLLIIAPETFTSDIWLNRISDSPTVQKVADFLKERPGAEMLYGASTYELFGEQPSILARSIRNGMWVSSHNSAVLEDSLAQCQIFHKSKLVVGTELTPYPKIFVPLDNWLSGIFKVGGLMGRCEGQDEISLLYFDQKRIPIGCAICYESVYGEYCTDYVRKGAKAMAVITNDAWWGDTPGYRQHLSYSCLRAIELRRDIARCGNTGISCFINQKGDILEQSEWWTRTILSDSINLNSEETFFVRYGDITGRICCLIFGLLLLLLIVRGVVRR